MIRILALLFCLLFFHPPSFAEGKSLGFLEWKLDQINQAQSSLNSVPSERAPADLEKLRFNVNLALNLTIQDYTNIYLSSLTESQLPQALNLLTKQEMSEILLFYTSNARSKKESSLVQSPAATLSQQK